MELEQPSQPTHDHITASIAPLADHTAPTLASQPRGVFIGRFGLRAGWGILIYLIVSIVLLILIQLGTLAAQGQLHAAMEARRQAAIAHKSGAAPAKPAPSTHVDAPMPPRPVAIGETGLFVAIGLASLLLATMERRRAGVYGIGSHGFLRFFPGAFWGLASMSLLIFALHAGRLLVFDGRILFGSAAVLYALKWLLVFLLVGFFEEYLFRGYVQFTLTRAFFGLGEKISPTAARGISFLFASVITSLIFFFAHTSNTGENAFGLFSVFLAGVVFTYALWRTGSLWWAIGFHMAWDWAQSFLYGVPDSGNLSAGRLFQTHAAGNPLWSGGTAGPEGSVLVVPILLLVLLVIRFTPPGVQPSLETKRPLADPHTESATPQWISA